MSFFLEVFQSAFSPMVLFYMIAGVAAGICIGALPGLTATMGVALLLPLTFGMDATAGILMLLGIYVGAIYGGSISAILLHTPGTPASAATAIDGYQFSKRGEAGRALGIATLSSYIGGVVSCLCLWLISPQLAKLALKFSSAEFFLLAVFGLCIIANISGENMAKGLICGFLGILTATVGIDSVTSYIRFTDNANLLSGIQYIKLFGARSKNDGAWHNYRTVSTFSSTCNAGMSKLYNLIGMENSTNAYGCNGLTAVTDSLFSVKYTISNRLLVESDIRNYYTGSDGEFVYKNNYTLPIGYAINSSTAYDLVMAKNNNGIENQNLLIQSLTGISDVFEYTTSFPTEADCIITSKI